MERDLKDVLSLQDEVADQIASQVGIKVAAGQQTRVASVRQIDPEAHEAYLKGDFYWSRSNCDGSQKGLVYYQQAVSKDPSFAAAYVGLSQAYFTLGDWGCLPYKEAFSQIKSRGAQKKRSSLTLLWGQLTPCLQASHISMNGIGTKPTGNTARPFSSIRITRLRTFCTPCFWSPWREKSKALPR